MSVWRAENNVLKKGLNQTMRIKRPLGRPRTRWKNTVEKDISKVDSINKFNWHSIGKDKEDGSSGPTNTVKLKRKRRRRRDRLCIIFISLTLIDPLITYYII